MMKAQILRCLGVWFLACWAGAALAAIEVNQASSDDLESIKGIGPSTAQRILQQRRQAAFRDWADFIVRVPGIGDRRAAQLSDQGLRVRGEAFELRPPTPATPKPPIGYAPRTQTATGSRPTAP